MNKKDFNTVKDENDKRSLDEMQKDQEQQVKQLKEAKIKHDEELKAFDKQVDQFNSKKSV